MGVYAGSPPFGWVDGKNLAGKFIKSQQICEAMQALTNRADNVDVAIFDWAAYGYEGEYLADLGQTPADLDLKTNKAFRHVYHIDDLRVALEAVCPSYYVGSTDAPDFWTIETLLQAAVSRDDYNRTTGELQDLGYLDGKDLEELLKCIDLLVYTEVIIDDAWDGEIGGVPLLFEFNETRISVDLPDEWEGTPFDTCEPAFTEAKEAAIANLEITFDSIIPSPFDTYLAVSTAIAQSRLNLQIFPPELFNKWIGSYTGRTLSAVATPQITVDDGYFYYVTLTTQTFPPRCGADMPYIPVEVVVEERTAFEGAEHIISPGDFSQEGPLPCDCSEPPITPPGVRTYNKTVRETVRMDGPFRRHYTYS